MGIEAKRRTALIKAAEDLGDHSKHTFFPLRQGPWAPFDIGFAELFHRKATGESVNIRREWALSVIKSPHLFLEYQAHRRELREAMGEVLQLVGVDRPSEIPDILKDGRRVERAKPQVNRAVGRLYGDQEIGGRIVKENRRAKAVNDYGLAANGYIESLKWGVLNPIAYKIRPSEEAIARNHPLDLLALVFTPGYDPKLGFEALRKIFLMTKIAAIDYRSTELAEGGAYQRFTDLLDERFWTRTEGQLKGQLTEVVLLSKHSPDDYSVLEIERVMHDRLSETRKKVREQKLETNGHYLRLTTLPSRTFSHRDGEVLAFIDPRQKPFNSRITKMLRQGLEDPSTAVEDKLGMVIVVEDQPDVDTFLDHLREVGKNTGSLLRIEGLEDSFKKTFSAKHVGSSPKTEMVKFYARVHGVRIEVIVHTYESYINSIWHDEAGHSEFEVRRMIDTGLFDLLFPPSIYPEVNSSEDREELLNVLHHSKRTASNSIG